MTVPDPVPEPVRVHGLDLYVFPAEVSVWDGRVCVAQAFPVVVAELDGPWFGRRYGTPARKFGTRHEALAYVVGGCPDCTCGDRTCEVCLKGCPVEGCGS